MKSTSAAVLHPFSILELNEKDGIPYSMNAVSKNLIVLNRLSKPNFNSFIIGKPGELAVIQETVLVICSSIGLLRLCSDKDVTRSLTFGWFGHKLY